MANQKLMSVALPCGHFILVPAYQTKNPMAYEMARHCDKCAAGLDPHAVKVRAKAKV